MQNSTDDARNSCCFSLSLSYMILFNAVLNLLLCFEVVDVGAAGEDRILDSDMPGWEINYQMYSESTTSSAAGSTILRINYGNGEVEHGGQKLSENFVLRNQR